MGEELLLEVAASSRKRSGGCTGFGFALLAPGSRLLHTGGGVLGARGTFNQANHVAILHGLRAAQSAGAARVCLRCDSSLVVKQLTRLPSSASHLAALEDVRAAMAGFEQVAVSELARPANGLALVQAEWAADLARLLYQVAGTPPSRYAAFAGQLGLLLQLPMQARRMLETAADFADATAQLVAARSGAGREQVAALVASAAPPDSSAVVLSMARRFTAPEGAAYAAAATAAVATAAPAAEDSSVAGLHVHAAELQLEAAGLSAPPQQGGKASDASSSRMLGRHRLSRRLLVLGLHKLPEQWHPGGEAAAAATPAATPPPPAAAAAAAGVIGAPEPQRQPQQGASRCGELDDLLLSSWTPSGGPQAPASNAEGAGLGELRYELPSVNSDTATHLLQFDGAARNNPGRAGYGYVLFDLASGHLVARGCMSLPYGVGAVRAEFEGLLAGLSAAAAAGVRSLAVQGDSSSVLDALMFRRGISTREMSALYFKTSQALLGFDSVDFQYVPREANGLADRLAQMSMDIDTAMYALLRKDERGLRALQVVAKAARMKKKAHVLELLLQRHSLPLLLVVLLQRVMGISPAVLLERLAAKAAAMGDPNAWLVREVRALTQAGLPQAQVAEVGAILMDGRYERDALARLKQQQQLASSAAPGLTGPGQQARHFSCPAWRPQRVQLQAQGLPPQAHLGSRQPSGSQPTCALAALQPAALSVLAYGRQLGLGRLARLLR